MHFVPSLRLFQNRFAAVYKPISIYIDFKLQQDLYVSVVSDKM